VKPCLTDVCLSRGFTGPDGGWSRVLNWQKSSSNPSTSRGAVCTHPEGWKLENTWTHTQGASYYCGPGFGLCDEIISCSSAPEWCAEVQLLLARYGAYCVSLHGAQPNDDTCKLYPNDVVQEPVEGTAQTYEAIRDTYGVSIEQALDGIGIGELQPRFCLWGSTIRWITVPELQIRLMKNMSFTQVNRQPSLFWSHLRIDSCALYRPHQCAYGIGISPPTLTCIRMHVDRESWTL
jgi:hypothetical protein